MILRVVETTDASVWSGVVVLALIAATCLAVWLNDFLRPRR